jgi:hypothetical protein
MKLNTKILFMFSMLFSSVLPTLNQPLLENIDETGRPLGEVCEGKKAERLMADKEITPLPGQIFFSESCDEAFAFRQNADYEKSRHAGTSTSYGATVGAQAGLIFNPVGNVEGSVVRTNFTEIDYYQRDRYFNDFNLLRSPAQWKSFWGHCKWTTAALAGFGLCHLAGKNAGLANNKPLIGASRAFLACAAAWTYLGYKNIRHYATVKSKKYFEARTKTAKKKYYKYDDLIRECRRPGFYRDILLSLVAAAAVGVVFSK